MWPGIATSMQFRPPVRQFRIARLRPRHHTLGAPTGALVRVNAADANGACVTVERRSPRRLPMATELSSRDEVAVLDADGDLLRVIAEFHEMPDLVVTVAQASRLFGVDHAHSRRILDALVSRGVLSTDGRQFGRAGTGRRGI